MNEALDAVDIADMLRTALATPSGRTEVLRRFEERVGNSDISGLSNETCEVVRDLAYDCAFFTQKKSALAEDFALLSDHKIVPMIENALRHVEKELSRHE